MINQPEKKPRKLVTINEKKKDSFAIGVSADNYHFVTKLAEANGSNRTAILDKILDKYAADVLRGVA
jgi:hypothetical protein